MYTPISSDHTLFLDVHFNSTLIIILCKTTLQCKHYTVPQTLIGIFMSLGQIKSKNVSLKWFVGETFPFGRKHTLVPPPQLKPCSTF